MTDTQNLLLSAANDVAKVQVEAIKQAVIAEMSKLERDLLPQLEAKSKSPWMTTNICPS